MHAQDKYQSLAELKHFTRLFTHPKSQNAMPFTEMQFVMNLMREKRRPQADESVNSMY
jgi:acetyl-CoA carboxylase beta subunit